MSSRPAKVPRRPAATAEDREDLALIQRRMRDVAEGRDEVVPLTAEDRADLAASRRAVREMEASGEKPIPWEVVKAHLAELREREDAATAEERGRNRRLAPGACAASPRKRAAAGKRQR